MFGQEPFRLEPAGRAQDYQTFQIRMPRGPEFERSATCEEAGCLNWRNGWATALDPTAQQDLVQALMHSGRGYRAVSETATRTVFYFAPGTPCFQASQHKVAVRPDIPELFIVRDGDWRGNPTGRTRTHARPDDWVEHFQETTEAVRERIEKG